MNNCKKIILASASPRRKELLKSIGMEFEIMVSDKETEISEADPIKACREQAINKGLDIFEKAKMIYRDEDLLIISADTIVAVDDRILGKPGSREEARSMLKLLSDRSHDVYTAVCICDSRKSDVSVFVEKTKVQVAELREEEIEDYISSSEPYDKAGAYAIQGIFAKHIEKIDGDFYNVMGLPIGRLYRDYIRDN